MNDDMKNTDLVEQSFQHWLRNSSVPHMHENLFRAAHSAGYWDGHESVAPDYEPAHKALLECWEIERDKAGYPVIVINGKRPGLVICPDTKDPTSAHTLLNKLLLSILDDQDSEGQL